MKRSLLDVYVSPMSHARLQLESGDGGADDVVSGELVAPDGSKYTITAGIPNFISSDMLTESEQSTQNEYQGVADRIYDVALDWLFQSFHESEDAVRESMIDALHVERGSKILEIGCGTGRDSFRIAQRLGAGQFYVQDLAPNMVAKTRQRLEADRQRLGLECEVQYFVSSGTHLPFRDGYFDSVFHFGGFNNFADQKKSMADMTRIVRKGGRVVVGDESVPPWLEDTEFGEIVTTNNAQFKAKLPLHSLPPNARDVHVRWLLGGCFYLIDFTVGEGTPPLNLDLRHEGWRGGTMRSRYFGRMEGVTPEAKQMAIDAARRSGISVHEWLDKLVRQAAKSGPE